jgi:hypothetical protein
MQQPFPRIEALKRVGERKGIELVSQRMQAIYSKLSAYVPHPPSKTHFDEDAMHYCKMVNNRHFVLEAAGTDCNANEVREIREAVSPLQVEQVRSQRTGRT